MCSSYTSGLCGAPEPARDMGNMPSARLTAPDVPAVLAPWYRPPLVHYGAAELDEPTVSIICGAPDGYCTTRLDHPGVITCPDCIEAVRRRARDASRGAGNEAA